MITANLVARLEACTAGAIADSLAPGLAIAVADGSGHVWSAGYGTADATTGAPVTVESVFEAASLSKPVVAFGALLLVQEGVLDLDRPLDSYLAAPYLPSDSGAAEITARMVLGHTTGLPNWRPRGQPLALLRRPGSRFGYSGEGFVYLQRVLEHLTGRPLDRFLDERVLHPLGMAHSTFVWTRRLEPRAVRGHDRAGAPLPQEKPGHANAAASLHTSVADFARFLGALLGPADAGPLREQGVDAMLRPHSRLQGPLAWGLGWGLHAGAAGGTLFWQWGDNRGFKAFAAGARSGGTGIVVLTNGDAGLAAAERLVLTVLPPLGAAFDALRDFGPYLT